MLRARKNYLHFQIPFTEVSGNSLYNKMKLLRVNELICNSKFTKGFVDEEYGVDSMVIYPPVDLNKFKSKRKENIILGVGRFSQLTQAKRQDTLVKAFKKLTKNGFGDWKLVLAGGAEVGVNDFLIDLKKEAVAFKIEIIESPDFDEIVDLFGRSKIFWSASGYGVDEEKEPNRVEHFGISVVEAMSAGCVPMVLNSGGHKEIVSNGEDGILWTKVNELVKYTKRYINDPKSLLDVSRKAKEKSKLFGYETFEKRIEKVLF